MFVLTYIYQDVRFGITGLTDRLSRPSETGKVREKSQMKMIGITTEHLATIIASLVKEGLTFEASPGRHEGEWEIELTGGY
jgi:hypothetical protein